MEFEFAKDFKTAEQKQKEWWLSLTPAQRWEANWKHIQLLKDSNLTFFNEYFSQEDKTKYKLV
jgi:hypothetical protein